MLGLVFLDKFHPPHPYTIVIKVHLSAISLPRKQLSVKNSACFFCFVLFFRVFFVSGLVFVPRSYSMWVDFFILLKGNRGADPRVLVKCFVRCGSLLGRPVTCTPLKPRSSEMRTMRTIPEGLPASAWLPLWASWRTVRRRRMMMRKRPLCFPVPSSSCVFVVCR